MIKGISINRKKRRYRPSLTNAVPSIFFGVSSSSRATSTVHSQFGSFLICLIPRSPLPLFAASVVLRQGNLHLISTVNRSSRVSRRAAIAFLLYKISMRILLSLRFYRFVRSALIIITTRFTRAWFVTFFLFFPFVARWQVQ